MANAEPFSAKQKRRAERPPRQPGSPYTVKEAAAYLRVNERTIWNLIHRGLLRPSKALRLRLIPADDVETLVTRTR